MPLFEHVRLAERYDLAIASTKGMSVTACRELLDRMCGQEVPMFVLHDFDKAGFSILGTLRQNTRRYKFRSGAPAVIDLGLRLVDIGGLESEDTFDQGGKSARRANLRANGATEEEIVDRRVELNAMTSDRLIACIEAKLGQHGVKKIVPDAETLAQDTASCRGLRSGVFGMRPRGVLFVMASIGYQSISFLPYDLHLGREAKIEAFVADSDGVSRRPLLRKFPNDCARSRSRR